VRLIKFLQIFLLRTNSSK